MGSQGVRFAYEYFVLWFCVPRYVHPLDLNTEYVIGGVSVTLLEALHCPGAALIHFRLPTGLCYLHTGDFRASKCMQSYALLLKQKVNVLYLDTTYCNPKYKYGTCSISSYLKRTLYRIQHFISLILFF